LARFFSQQWIDELMTQADIVQVVSEYVHLKKRGNSYWGLCPFHKEKTPSFSVSPDLNLYYCHGCKAGGSIIQFQMEMEKESYPEALESLGNLFHIPLPPDNVSSYRNTSINLSRIQKERLYEVNKAAAQFYHARLWQDEGRPMLEYLYSRKLTDAIIRKFGLGASGTGWNDLSTALTQQGFSLEEMAEAGLIVQKEEHNFDVFRERIVFPIIDARSNVLGFGARVIHNNEPKYLNTSDTPVFNKRKGVFGLNLVKKAGKLPFILLVEGYMDVIALVQSGLSGVVATLGTSLSVEQAKLLFRYSDRIHIAYDGDEAGQAAIERAIEVFRSINQRLYVIKVPNNLDPDEFVSEYGLNAFLQLSPTLDLEYLLDRLSVQYDFSTEDGKMNYAAAAAKKIALSKIPLEIDRLCRALAIKTGYTLDAVRDQVVLEQQALGIMTQRNEQREIIQRNRRFTRPIDEDSMLLPAEEVLLNLWGKSLLPEGLLSQEDFITVSGKKLADALTRLKKPAKVLSELEDEHLIAKSTEIFIREEPLSPSQALSAAEDCMNQLKATRIRKSIEEIRQSLNTLPSNELIEALKEIEHLSEEENKLKQQKQQLLKEIR
jgi:DNA primase